MVPKKLLQGIALSEMGGRGGITRGMITQNRTKNQVFNKVKTIVLPNKLCKPISLCLLSKVMSGVQEYEKIHFLGNNLQNFTLLGHFQGVGCCIKMFLDMLGQILILYFVLTFQASRWFNYTNYICKLNMQKQRNFSQICQQVIMMILYSISMFFGGQEA